MFFPLTQLIGLDPGKAGWLVDLVCERFPVPAGYGERIRAELNLPASTPARPVPTDRVVLADGILAQATPERTDRLFPGDLNGLGAGGAHTAVVVATGDRQEVHEAAEDEEQVDADPARADQGPHGTVIEVDEIGVNEILARETFDPDLLRADVIEF